MYTNSSKRQNNLGSNKFKNRIEFSLLYSSIFHGKRFSNSFSEGLEPIFSMRVFKYSFASIPLAIAV